MVTLFCSVLLTTIVGGNKSMCSGRFESFNNATYEEFPLKFGADSVLVNSVKFTDCARPLLFNGTTSVTVYQLSY